MAEEGQDRTQEIGPVGIASTVAFGQATVSLAVEEENFTGFVARTFDEHIALGEHGLRERVAKKTLRIF